MIDLSVIIVSYNTKEILKGCIESLFAHLPKSYSFEVIVVDNASSDGSIETLQNLELRIKNYDIKFKIINNRENFGFSKANNIGIKEVKGRYMLFLNSDTLMHENTLDEMVKFMDENPNAGAATCKVELKDKTIDDASHRGFPTPWRAFCYFSGLSRIFPTFKIFSGYNLGYLDKNTTHEIDACAGAFMIVRKEAGKKVNWWDEDYFWYGDDLDFCYRLKQAGWKIYFVPKVSIFHYKGISGGIKGHSKEISTADVKTKKLATKARFEAMKIFYRKHYMDKYPSIITNLVMLGISLKLSFALAKI